MCRMLSVCGCFLALGWLIMVSGDNVRASSTPRNGPFFSALTFNDKPISRDTDSDGDDGDDGDDISNMC